MNVADLCLRRTQEDGVTLILEREGLRIIAGLTAPRPAPYDLLDDARRGVWCETKTLFCVVAVSSPALGGMWRQFEQRNNRFQCRDSKNRGSNDTGGRVDDNGFSGREQLHAVKLTVERNDIRHRPELYLDQNQSQALYKARETLANIGSPTEAVGKTSQVTGSIAFTNTGAIDSSASKITIDLSTLQSDKSQRDNYIKRNTLNTDQFPDAVFVPTGVQGLSWPLPTSGQATFKLTGNLTVHGQTSQTTWDVTATFGPKQINGTATTTVKFEDFGMKPPSTMLVISVEDNLTLELDFFFTLGS